MAEPHLHQWVLNFNNGLPGYCFFKRSIEVAEGQFRTVESGDIPWEEAAKLIGDETAKFVSANVELVRRSEELENELRLTKAELESTKLTLADSESKRKEYESVVTKLPPGWSSQIVTCGCP